MDDRLTPPRACQQADQQPAQAPPTTAPRTPDNPPFFHCQNQIRSTPSHAQSELDRLKRSEWLNLLQDSLQVNCLGDSIPQQVGNQFSSTEEVPRTQEAQQSQAEITDQIGVLVDIIWQCVEDERVYKLSEDDFRDLQITIAKYISVAIRSAHSVVTPFHMLLETTNFQFMQKVAELEARSIPSNKTHNLLAPLVTSDRIGPILLSGFSDSGISPWRRLDKFDDTSKGTSGKVYLATNPKQEPESATTAIAAVKQIKIDEKNVKEKLAKKIKQIATEIALLENIDHQYIVSFKSAEFYSNTVAIVMEHCNGHSLAHLLKHGRIHDEDVIKVHTFQLLDALRCIHEKGFIHGDIKPDNILFQDISLKCADFGSGQKISEGHFLGSPMYASPEYINNIAVAAVDLWSLGCVVLEMATGHMPWVEYTGKLEFRIGRSSELGGPPLPSPDEAGPLCIDFLRQCFTIDHTQRPTASQLMQHEWLHAVVNVG